MEFISTDVQPPRDRFRFWADFVAKKFAEADIDSAARSRFSGRVRHLTLDRLAISDVAAWPQIVHRSRASIARAPSDAVLLCLQIEGDCHFESKNLDKLLKPGDACVVSLDIPYRLKFDTRFRQIVIKCPQDALRVADNKLHGGQPSRALSRVMRQMAVSAAREDIGFSLRERSVLASSLVGMMSSCVAEGAGPRHDDFMLARRRRILRFIDENYADAALGVRSISKRFALSERSLVRLFCQHDATLSETIRERRLTEAYDLLRDSKAGGLTIGEIALRCGFDDLAHFSHAFKRRYGVAPTKFRAAP